MNVLLFNPYPARPEPNSQWPHYGLTLLASALAKRGHRALVVDYSFTPGAPRPDHWIGQFSPDVVGISVYTAYVAASRSLIAEVRAATTVPLVLGGPHATLYADELLDASLGDVVVTGEADVAFPEHLEAIAKRQSPRRIDAAAPDAAEIPRADFSLGHGHEQMRYRPIQLSRGCPYGCSFCSVKCISTRQVRYRDLAACLSELADDLAARPGLRFVRIVDDCPTFDLPRFKRFLEGYMALKPRRPVHIDNLRADRLDDELIATLKRVGVDHLCLGVESGNPAVFAMVNKGETLDEIVDAARIIKRHGIRLYLCFVIGLPGATAEAEMDSIRLARRLKPNWMYWNLYQPHRGTKAREWFEEYGRLLNEEDTSSLIGLDLTTTAAPCDTAEFPADERRRTQVKAALLTGTYSLQPKHLPGVFRAVQTWSLWGCFFRGLMSAVRINSGAFVHQVVWRSGWGRQQANSA